MLLLLMLFIFVFVPILDRGKIGQQALQNAVEAEGSLLNGMQRAGVQFVVLFKGVAGGPLAGERRGAGDPGREA